MCTTSATTQQQTTVAVAAAPPLSSATTSSSSTSLFGAVMNKLQTPTPPAAAAAVEDALPTIPGANTHSSLSHAPSSSTTSHTRNTKSSSTMNNINTPGKKLLSTTTTHAVAAAYGAALQSPGGFQLLDFVSGLQQSPFQAGGVTRTMASTTRTTPHSSRKRLRGKSYNETPRRTNDEEWHECALTEEQPYYFPLIDWSIKSAAEFECQPSSVLWQMNADDWRIQREAMRQFVANSNPLSSSWDSFQSLHHLSHNNNDTDHSAALTAAGVEWNAGLFYWQHPASPPPTSGKEKATLQSSSSSIEYSQNVNPGQQKMKKELLNSDSRSNNGSRFFGSMQPPPSKKQPRGVENNNTESRLGDERNASCSTLKSKRKTAWQDAFRSLYMTWIDQIQNLNGRWARTVKSGDDAELVRMISDTYFYACETENAILFRVGIEAVPNGGLDGRGTTALVPEIVVSSSTPSVRRILQRMGANIYLTGSNDINDLVENVPTIANLKNVPSNGSSNKMDLIGLPSPNFKDEMVALRRSQARGLTVGAEVSVSLGGKQCRKYQPEQEILPLRLVGMDDSSMFCEMFLNFTGLNEVDYRYQHSKGIKTKKLGNVNMDVPLLLCRKLGPFLHASIQTVSVLQTKADDAEDQVDESFATVSLRGYLLPCAIRDLVGASVNLMKAHGRAADKIAGGTNPDPNDNRSHHLVVRTHVHTENSVSSAADVTVGLKSRKHGSNSSELLNGDWDLINHLHGVNPVPPYCSNNETLMLAIWDATRPESIAFKLEASSLLF